MFTFVDAAAAVSSGLFTGVTSSNKTLSNDSTCEPCWVRRLSFAPLIHFAHTIVDPGLTMPVLLANACPWDCPLPLPQGFLPSVRPEPRPRPDDPLESEGGFADISIFLFLHFVVNLKVPFLLFT